MAGCTKKKKVKKKASSVSKDTDADGSTKPSKARNPTSSRHPASPSGPSPVPAGAGGGQMGGKVKSSAGSAGSAGGFVISGPGSAADYAAKAGAAGVSRLGSLDGGGGAVAGKALATGFKRAKSARVAAKEPLPVDDAVDAAGLAKAVVGRIRSDDPARRPYGGLIGGVPHPTPPVLERHVNPGTEAGPDRVDGGAAFERKALDRPLGVAKTDGLAILNMG